MCWYEQRKDKDPSRELLLSFSHFIRAKLQGRQNDCISVPAEEVNIMRILYFEFAAAYNENIQDTESNNNKFTGNQVYGVLRKAVSRTRLHFPGSYHITWRRKVRIRWTQTKMTLKEIDSIS